MDGGGGLLEVLGDGRGGVGGSGIRVQKPARGPSASGGTRVSAPG